MKLIDSAIEEDANGDLLRAYKSYLKAIQSGDANDQDYINASFLAFIFQDFGVSSHLKIPDEIVDEARNEMLSLLDDCEKRFGKQKEIDFWRKYYELILNGKTEFNDFCMSYVLSVQKNKIPVNEKERYLASLRVEQ